jgi:hypothetical protein
VSLEKMSWYRSCLIIAAVAAVCALSCLSASRSFKRHPLSGDAVENVTMAYNLFHKGVYSGTRDAVPTGYRQPGLPTYLAGAMLLDRGLRGASLEELTGDDGMILRLKYAQMPLLLLAAAGAMVLARMVTGNTWLGVGALLLTGISPGMHASIDLMTPELMTGLLIVCVAIAACMTVRRRSYAGYAAIGVAMAVLVMSRAIFVYAIPMVAAGMAVAAIRPGVNRRRLVRGAVVFAAASMSLPLAWMTRNYVSCDGFMISGRGGIVLLTRANYDMMNATEYAGSLFWWTPGHYVREVLLQKVFGKDAVSQKGVLANLNRENPDGFFGSAYGTMRTISKETGLSAQSLELDQQLKRMAVAKIREHPMRHVAAILPFAYQGSFMELGRLTPMALPYWLAGAFLLVGGIRARRMEWVAIALPALYLLAMHSMITHNLPRYNSPAIPVLTVALVVAIQVMYRRYRSAPAAPSVSACDTRP